MTFNHSYNTHLFPAGYPTGSLHTTARRSYTSPYSMPSHDNKKQPIESGIANRYSVVYLLKEQYKHVGCATREQAQLTLKALLDDKERSPVGIYDEKTELFDWDHSLREEYEKASMNEQGRWGEEIINITKALRRRDLAWDTGEFRRPGLFA